MKNSDKAIQFQQLHQDDCFVMANAWSAGSAFMLEQAGFKAIGTSSAGIAYNHALADASLSFDVALQDTAEIVAAVDIPVSMDAENGYADSPEAVYDNMGLIAATGVVGASIEDYTGNPDNPFYDIDLAVERIRAAHDAISDLGFPFTLTARADCYLYGHPEPFAESVKRVNRYREAGADCLYVPGVRDIETIGALVNEVDGPVNVVMGLSGSPMTVDELKSVGVTRISIGGSLARATFGLVRRAAQEILEQGSFTFSEQQIPDAELSRLFSERSSS
jgi:2-methylisocitrate lyase-like PEP mutase family enzyme